MDWINRSISNYQEIIGAYEKQMWERSLEKAVLKRLSNVTRKNAKVNLDLIDVDLIRGSTFSNAKSKRSFISILKQTIPRVLFLPAYQQWWKQSTSRAIFYLLTLLYSLQIVSLIAYLNDDTEQLSSEMLVHLISPCILLFAVTFVQTQISEASPSSSCPASGKRIRNKKHINRRNPCSSVSEQDSTGSNDTGIDLNPDDTREDNLQNCRRKSCESLKAAQKAKTSQIVANAYSDSDESTTIRNNVSMHCSLDADDESDESFSTSSNLRRISFEKTKVWLRTLDKTAADVSLDKTGKDEQKRHLAYCPLPMEEGIRQTWSAERFLSSSCRRDCRRSLPLISGDRTNHFSDTFNKLHIPFKGLSVKTQCLLEDCKNIKNDDCPNSQNVQKKVLSKTTPSFPACPDSFSVHHQNGSHGNEHHYPIDPENSEQKQKSEDARDHCTDSCSFAQEFSEHDSTASEEDLPEERSAAVKKLASENSTVSCFIWTPEEVQRVELTGFEISSQIMQRVEENAPQSYDDVLLLVAFSLVFMLTPVFYRLYHSREQLATLDLHHIPDAYTAIKLAVGNDWRQGVVTTNGLLQRFCLGIFHLFLLLVAERTFQQRLLSAKNFCGLTSSRRTKKYNLPHFRLNKVQNIKTWISLRSFLRQSGPQQSVEAIVSNTITAGVVIISVISIQLLQDCGGFLDHLGNWELVVWGLALGLYLMKYITLGMKINRKYRNSSALITEQINLYLHMEGKPDKKDELMMANNVLRLTENLLKELESPFKVSGLSANPLLYNIIKVVVLSAFSAVLTELFGFKLKLYKINLRS